MDSPTTWIAVAIAAISTISGIVLSINGRLAAKDKLQYDAKLVLLEHAQLKCVEDHKECKEETKALNRRIDELQGIGVV